ncbi:DUF1653 domain-containing protein [Acetatifactor muris]|uniref:DUF1653 domain-containing protein n=1 Tax=Acetatifactor muris TaxID=879566 RepID=A0A2K4ZCD3_9FIRM|nr:DUF1653 domain-containing protein [Acetatifactor muris]MCR2046315.1 DUF1653 domain-containing protein [Acetatifactor muris]SOY28117.1 hypothetical protein AMURIS_00825 [Acetatifactor muris]
MSFIPKPQEIYKHFKGNLYQITAVAEHTETGETLVVYQALYGDFRTYARPLDMFVSKVDREKYPDAKQEFRFELQGPDADRHRADRLLEYTKAGETDPDEADKKGTIHTGTGGEAYGKDAVQSDMDPDACGELSLDPLVMEFLDADSYEQRLNILAGLHHRITDDMLTTMAIACDIEINDGDIEERYEALRACLLTLERYECNRLR